MAAIPDSFEFQYGESTLVYGRGRVDAIGERLDERDLDRALVVCGSNVGANDALMDGVRTALGPRLAGVYDGTIPAKTVESIYGGIDAIDEFDADVIVGVGGGSSLDSARQISALDADGRSIDELSEELEATGEITSPTGEDALPVAVVPTTLPGADLSSGGSIEVVGAEASPTGHPVRISGRVTPFMTVYDPDLFATTPDAHLAGSAPNGFNKGVETLYAANATPITDSTAMRGIGLLADGLRRLDEPDGLDRTVVGYVLAQYERRTSILHACASGFARRYDVQQGIAHAIVAPPVLRYLFDSVDARRELLAHGFGIDTASMSPDEVADAIVSEYVDLRAALGLPERLSELGTVPRDDLPAVAEYVAGDSRLARAPDGLAVTAEAIEAVLDEAW